MNHTPTIVAADGHVHVYPAYDITALFRHLIQNLDRLAGLPAGPVEPETTGNGIFKLAFLAESREHDFFSRLQNQDKAVVGNDLEALSGADPMCVTVSVRGAGRVCLVAGRQMVTRERLEILGLAMCAKIPDGLPAADVIRRVVEAGGIPVLAWSPGKWLFARGRLVRNLIESEASRGKPRGNLLRRSSLGPTPPEQSSWAYSAEAKLLAAKAGLRRPDYAGRVFAEPCDLSAEAIRAKGEANSAIPSSIAASATEDPSCGSLLRRTKAAGPTPAKQSFWAYSAEAKLRTAKAGLRRPGCEGREPQGFLAKKGDQDRVLRLGDTTLRPTLWPEPRLMKLARQRGIMVISGSDPLPFAGEERYAGTYGFIYQGPFDAERPVASIRQILTGPGVITSSGERCRPWVVARRLIRLRESRSILSVQCGV